MTAATILTLANGKGVDLLDLKVEDIDFDALAEHLGKETRFNGATPGVQYSVAQHLCLGTDAMLKDGATEQEAAYFLLHDVQEGIWKDDPTPKKIAIATRIHEECGVLADRVLEILDGIVEEHDGPIHQAAGLPYPIPEEIHRVVKLYDKKMFVTEWYQLMRNWPHPNWSDYENVTPINMEIDPWPWEVAADLWQLRAHLLLPALRKCPRLRLVTDDSHNTRSRGLELNGGMA